MNCLFSLDAGHECNETEPCGGLLNFRLAEGSGAERCPLFQEKKGKAGEKNKGGKGKTVALVLFGLRLPVPHTFFQLCRAKGLITYGTIHERTGNFLRLGGQPEGLGSQPQGLNASQMVWDASWRVIRLFRESGRPHQRVWKPIMV